MSVAGSIAAAGSVGVAGTAVLVALGAFFPIALAPLWMLIKILLGVFVFMGCVASLILLRDWTGFLISAAILELAYLFDCADGQLARLKKMTSEAGAYFDFLIDEVKALLLVGACAVRIWLDTDVAWWLVVGIVGCALVSIATSLTNFVRRPEYSGQEIKPGASARQPGMPPGASRSANS